MKLYHFPYSSYARKVQMVLDLLGLSYELVEVPYGDRSELVRVTGGYVQVPVLVDDAGAVTVDSRAICLKLVASPRAPDLVPAPWQGAIWAYADWCDGPLEEVLFRIAAPGLLDKFARPADRALYVFIKERKFGRGCMDEWAGSVDSLLDRTRELLAPTSATLRAQPFIFGESPTLADAALYGLCFMTRAATRKFLPAVGTAIEAWIARLEQAAAESRGAGVAHESV